MIFYQALPAQVRSSLILIFILCLIIMILSRKIKKVDPLGKPPLWLMPILWVVDIINNFIKQNIGKRWKSYAPYFCALAIFLFFANCSAIFLFDTPTSYVVVNAALAVITFVIIQVSGVVSMGIIGYLKSFVGPSKSISFLIIPINMVSEVTLPLSLTLRLTGNIISGGVISILVTGLLGYFAIPVLPVINSIFDVAFGTIQTVVFVSLSVIFTSMKIDDSEKIYA